MTIFTQTPELISSNSVTLLPRSRINTEKWNDVILSAGNTNLYGMSWYLDAVSQHGWHGIVVNDYEVVMPVYIKKKIILPYITQPFLCQNCGPYGRSGISDLDILQMLQILPGYLLKSSFNICNVPVSGFKDYKVLTKTNHFLPLYKSFDLIYEDYNRSTKRNILKAANLQIEMSETENPDFVYTFLLENDDTGILKKHNKTMKSLMKSAQANSQVLFQSARCDGEMIGAGFYVLFQDRIYWLLSAVNETGRNSRVMFAMVNRIIRKYSGQNWVFDFCGSSIPNVAQRNYGFGALQDNYYHLIKKGTIL